MSSLKHGTRGWLASTSALPIRNLSLRQTVLPKFFRPKLVVLFSIDIDRFIAAAIVSQGRPDYQNQDWPFATMTPPLTIVLKVVTAVIRLCPLPSP